MKLSEVRGHDRVRSILSRALERDRLPPALLFAGPDGVGRRTLALAYAQAALCESPGAEGACGECRACHLVEQGIRALPELRVEADGHRTSRESEDEESAWRNFRIHPDLILTEAWLLTREGKKRADRIIRTSQVRELIREINSSPFEARRKLFVIDDAHAMNEHAQNTFLKSLEEPPPRSHIILITSAPQALLPTIRSRCQVFRFGRLSTDTVAGLLQETLGADAEDARRAARRSGGSLELAGLFLSDAFLALRKDLLGILQACAEWGPVEKMQAAESLEAAVNDAEDPELPLLALRTLLRDLAAIRAGAPDASLLNDDLAEPLRALAGSEFVGRAIDLGEKVADTSLALRGFASKLLAFDILVDSLGSR